MLRRALAGFLLVSVGLSAAIALHLATAEGDTMFAGKRPRNLGVTDGKLAACGRRLNCVCSQSDPGDAQHHVAPIPFKGAAAEAIAAARRAVESMPRARVVRADGNYLHAEFRSKLMGFVDDVEFTFDAGTAALHVRSASRLGRRDFNVNRERVAALRARLVS